MGSPWLALHLVDAYAHLRRARSACVVVSSAALGWRVFAAGKP